MKKSRQIIITGLSIILATGAAVSVYLYKMDQQEDARQNKLILDEGIALYNQRKYPEALQILETIEPGSIEDWRLPFTRVQYLCGSRTTNLQPPTWSRPGV